MARSFTAALSLSSPSWGAAPVPWCLLEPVVFAAARRHLLNHPPVMRRGLNSAGRRLKERDPLLLGRQLLSQHSQHSWWGDNSGIQLVHKGFKLHFTIVSHPADRKLQLISRLNLSVINLCFFAPVPVAPLISSLIRVLFLSSFIKGNHIFSLKCFLYTNFLVHRLPWPACL